MIEPSTRLRRAIHLNDASLVSRLLRSHPGLLSNPDFSSKANTSLHLAASHGFTTIATLLIDAGHDGDEISRNADHNTPLMLAAQAGHVETATVLAVRFPWSIHYRNKDGLDALALATQNTASTGLIPTLLSGNGIHYADVESRDNEGNTPLHHASASGGLKALRLLLDAGADPTARNFYDWMPVAYSQTVAAEVYFRNLVAEYERRKMIEAEQRESGKVGIRAGAVRLVMDDEGSGGTADDDVMGKQAWSPSGERRRPPTPPGVRGGGDWGAATIALVRTRSGSGGQ